jgi:hypothetical protein
MEMWLSTNVQKYLTELEEKGTSSADTTRYKYAL